ncbi:MAG: DNA alkylation repair protein [Christensenellaceae bacterium]|jgi:3-methyladenine DNA glycosylase AlkD|nr:DNA alkylation repair protein [Christensenellaceae bacterium]
MDIYNPNDLIEYFETNKKPGLGDFHRKLIPTKYHIIGVPSKIVHNLSRQIATECDIERFFVLDNKRYFELVMTKGLVVAVSKLPPLKKRELLKEFIQYIDNWAINDVVCSKINVKKDYEGYFDFFVNLLGGGAFSVRFGLCGFLEYLDDSHIDQVLKLAGDIKSQEYYVRMMQAWLISDAFIKQKEKTLKFLKNSPLDRFTHNKAIQKIRESLRVSLEDKEMLLTLKKSNI